jgi:ATP-dependent DNA helicase RecG
MKDEEFKNRVRSFLFLTKETEWVEFKLNQSDPQEIGEYISALSNSAALHHEINGYIVWGIENKTRKIVGTNFKPRTKKIGNEELENWLATQLSPRIDFQIHEGEIEDKPIVIFQIQPAPNLPVRFKDTEYIRIGTYKKKLRDHPEKERLLWKLFTTLPFENALAATDVSSDEVLKLIDYPTYFRMMNIPLPENRKAILDRLSTEKILYPKSGDRFDVANVGAILFGYNLNMFERLQRKASRVIIYKGENRVETIKEQIGIRGYASGKQITNATLRERLNIKSANYPMASRIIRDTIEAGLIKPHTQVSGSKKDAKYTPFWA